MNRRYSPTSCATARSLSTSVGQGLDVPVTGDYESDAFASYAY
jgi:hypothetical protein